MANTITRPQAGTDSTTGANPSASANVIVCGYGRMGTLVRSALEATDDLHFVAAYDIEDSLIMDDRAPAVDLVIDFSAPASLPHLEAYVRRTGAALLSGTTGFSPDELARLEELGELAPVVHSANYSLGVAVLRRLVSKAAASLPGWDIEIVETHHNKKIDAPSGTAKQLLLAADPTGQDSVAYGREGIIGTRPAHEVGMHSLRGGTVAGTHEVHFFGTDEELCLTHRATSRQIFVAGALAAARVLLTKPAGLYTFDQLMFNEEA